MVAERDGRGMSGGKGGDCGVGGGKQRTWGG